MHQEQFGIITFDGECGFCNRSVRFILRRDRRKRFRFTPRQSVAGRRLLREHDVDPEKVDSLVLIQGGRAYTRSTAVLQIVRQMDGPWPLLSVFLAIPAPLRDLFYRLVARYRHRIAGRQDACGIPTAEMRERFLAEEAA